jgi:transporter family protein
MTAFVSALLASACWGIAPFFEKAGLSNTSDSTLGVFVRSTGVLIGTLALVPFFSRIGPRISEIPGRSMVFLFIGGVLASVIGQAFFYRALKLGEVSRAVAIGASYPVIAAILGLILFKEPLTWSKAGGIVMIAAGTLLLR